MRRRTSARSPRRPRRTRLPVRPLTAAPARLAAAAGLALSLAVPTHLSAQEGGRACTLVLEPTTDSTRSVSVETAPDRYVTHVSGGLRWTCGDATMVADSAVRDEQSGRLEMIGDADYRDSVRTLQAEAVTYHEAEDRIVAVDDVVLTRLATGSVLRGPRVEFLRGPGEGIRRTVAVGRPHMTIRPDTAAGEDDPVEVDADSVVMVGEEARTWGDVRIRRPDFDARADSAFFRRDEGTGVLHGSPVVTGEDFRLEGRTIHTRFREGELEEVDAVEEARAEGEEFELFAPRILTRLRDEKVHRLWAFGEGRSVAFSPPYRLVADSLEVAFADGAIDSLAAVGGSEAVEVGEERPDDPFADIPLSVGERSWVAGDTLTLWFAPVEEGDADDRELRRMRAAGEGRAYHLLRPDEEDGRPGRHYQRGRAIVIFLEDGEATRVEGTDAIGVHLDPESGGGG